VTSRWLTAPTYSAFLTTAAAEGAWQVLIIPLLQLFEILTSDDDVVTLVLRSHLVIEELLYTAIAAHCQEPAGGLPRSRCAYWIVEDYDENRL
jgi:hypothetical protein